MTYLEKLRQIKPELTDSGAMAVVRTRCPEYLRELTAEEIPDPGECPVDNRLWYQKCESCWGKEMPSAEADCESSTKRGKCRFEE